jgi:integrase
MGMGVLYGEWLVTWLEEHQRFAKETTHSTYSMAVINHIIPMLGSFALADITEQRVQEMALHWLEAGRCDGGGGLSRKTVHDILAIVKLSMKAAQKRYDIPVTPMEIRLPQQESVKRTEVFAPSELQGIVGAAMARLHSKSMGILLALYTGLRIGELCALQWRDVDLVRGTLTVTKTIQRIYKKELKGSVTSKMVITPPKTRSSVREVPLASTIAPLLHGFTQTNDCYLITGSPSFLEPRSYRAYYGRFLRRAGIAHSSFHKLRHTFATQLIEGGADVKTVSDLLGHASVKTTLDLYVHPQLEQKRKCVEMIPSFT